MVSTPVIGLTISTSLLLMTCLYLYVRLLRGTQKTPRSVSLTSRLGHLCRINSFTYLQLQKKTGEDLESVNRSEGNAKKPPLQPPLLPVCKKPLPTSSPLPHRRLRSLTTLGSAGVSTSQSYNSANDELEFDLYDYRGSREWYNMSLRELAENKMIFDDELEQVLSKANARLSSRCIGKEPSNDNFTEKQLSSGSLSLNQRSLESFSVKPRNLSTNSPLSSDTGSKATLVEEEEEDCSSVANEKDPKKSVLLTDTKSMESGRKYFSRSPSSVINETFESRNPSSVINDSFESRNPSSIVNYFVNERLVGASGSSVNYIVQKGFDSKSQLPPLALLDDLENWDA